VQRLAKFTVPGGEFLSVSSLSIAAEQDQKPNVIDDTHLQRMTLGDRRLEREVLELFVRQTTIMLNRITEADPRLAAAAAHTLKGSARGIGAWRVARAAERVEHAASGEGGEGTMPDAVAELKAASLEASAAIGARLSGLLAELARGR
jgi:HPt (histidine-containing phosphotransfer) domain-containing protein